VPTKVAEVELLQVNLAIDMGPIQREPVTRQQRPDDIAELFRRLEGGRSDWPDDSVDIDEHVPPSRVRGDRSTVPGSRYAVRCRSGRSGGRMCASVPWLVRKSCLCDTGSAAIVAAVDRTAAGVSPRMPYSTGHGVRGTQTGYAAA
jgi:hypothetical protein